MGERIFGLLLLAYPRGFRESWRDEMQRFFRDCLRDARRRGRWGVMRFWLDTLADVALTAPGQRIDALFHGIEAGREATLRAALVLLLTAVVTTATNYLIWSFTSALVTLAPRPTLPEHSTPLFLLLVVVSVGAVVACVIFASLNFRALAARRARSLE